MSKLRFKISMSLDGFVAGPSQSVDNPLGIGGGRLHEWAFQLAVFRALLGLFAADGRMILFSTHRFDMVEKLCSRVVILSAGRLVAERRVSDMDRTGAGSLEDIFVRVTEQPDYTPVAQQILDTICDA